MQRCLLLVILILILLASGCTGTADPIDIAKTSPTVMEFLGTYPESLIRSTYFDAVEVQNIIGNVRGDCNDTNIPVKEFYRVEFEDVGSGESLYAWIDIASAAIECVIKNRACGNNICEYGEYANTCPADCSHLDNSTTHESVRLTLFEGETKQINIDAVVYNVSLLGVNNQTAIIKIQNHEIDDMGSVDNNSTVTIGLLNIFAREIVFRQMDSSSNFIALEIWKINENNLETGCADNVCTILEGESVVAELYGFVFNITNLDVYDTESALIVVDDYDGLVITEHNTSIVGGLYIFANDILFFPQEENFNSVNLVLDVEIKDLCHANRCTIIEGNMTNITVDGMDYNITFVNFENDYIDIKVNNETKTIKEGWDTVIGNLTMSLSGVGYRNGKTYIILLIVGEDDILESTCNRNTCSIYEGTSVLHEIGDQYYEITVLNVINSNSALIRIDHDGERETKEIHEGGLYEMLDLRVYSSSNIYLNREDTTNIASISLWPVTNSSCAEHTCRLRECEPAIYISDDVFYSINLTDVSNDTTVIVNVTSDYESGSEHIKLWNTEKVDGLRVKVIDIDLETSNYTNNSARVKVWSASNICEDGDGMDYTTQGSVSGYDNNGTFVYIDSCYNVSHVYEWYCNETYNETFPYVLPAYEIVNCRFSENTGCNEGVCFYNESMP